MPRIFTGLEVPHEVALSLSMLRGGLRELRRVAIVPALSGGGGASVSPIRTRVTCPRRLLPLITSVLLLAAIVLAAGSGSALLSWKDESSSAGVSHMIQAVGLHPRGP